MSHSSSSRDSHLPAPCIIDSGIIVDKQDMRRVLMDLNRVRYLHTQDGKLMGTGEGCILEVIADPQRATLVANHALYLNVYSFDCLQLSLIQEGSAFDLIQDGRRLRLMPCSNPMQEQANRGGINVSELEAMVAEALSASLDVQMDDDENFSL